MEGKEFWNIKKIGVFPQKMARKMQNRRFFPDDVEKSELWKEEKKDLEHANRRFFPDDVK